MAHNDEAADAAMQEVISSAFISAQISHTGTLSIHFCYRQPRPTQSLLRNPSLLRQKNSCPVLLCRSRKLPLPNDLRRSRKPPLPNKLCRSRNRNCNRNKAHMLSRNPELNPLRLREIPPPISHPHRVNIPTWRFHQVRPVRTTIPTRWRKWRMIY